MPPPLLVDADGEDVVPLRIERPQHRLRGDHRDLVLRGTPPEHQGDPPARGPAHAFSKAWSKSSIRSSASSPPAATRISPSPIPAAARSSAGSCRCEVVAGWQTSVRRLPNDDPTRASRSESHARWAAHWLIAWGCILAAAVTFPLSFGWVHFKSAPDNQEIYQAFVFGQHVGRGRQKCDIQLIGSQRLDDAGVIRRHERLHLHAQLFLQDIDNRLGVLDDSLGIFRRDKSDAQNFGRTRRSAAADQAYERDQQCKDSLEPVHLSAHRY